jgi:hypothetical protein
MYHLKCSYYKGEFNNIKKILDYIVLICEVVNTKTLVSLSLKYMDQIIFNSKKVI